MNFYNQAQDSKKLMFVLYVTLRAKILRVVYNECINKCAFFVFHELQTSPGFISMRSARAVLHAVVYHHWKCAWPPEECALPLNG